MTGADWVPGAASPQGRKFLAAIRTRPVAAWRRLPPRVTGSLPFGLEHTVLRRYLAGRSCNVYPSALSGLYQRRASREAVTLFRLLVDGDPVSATELAAALGDTAVGDGRAAGLLMEAGAGLVRTDFRYVCVGNSCLLADPLTVRFHNRIHIGQDSEALCAFLAEMSPTTGRLLDVGTGSGVVLINEARRGIPAEAIGVDINPRAVVVAALNAQLNGVAAQVAEQDIFAAAAVLGRFDRITWNAPFRFLPDDEQHDNIDGFGGRLGIGLTLDFAAVLPGMLADGGEAVVMSAGPRMSNGDTPLDAELSAVARRAGLEITSHVQGLFFDNRRRDFLRSHGVEAFESVILTFRPGAGSFQRLAPPAGTRLANVARRLVNRLRG